jgi:hypothetical protein
MVVIGSGGPWRRRLDDRFGETPKGWQLHAVIEPLAANPLDLLARRDNEFVKSS